MMDGDRAGNPDIAPLHVAFNLVFLNSRSGGVGRYALELIPAMLEVEPTLRVTAYTSRELPREIQRLPWASDIEWVALPVRTSGGPPGTFALALAAQWLGIPLVGSLRRAQIVHGLANVTPLWMPGAVRVVTLLDLIWMHYPEALEPAAARGMRLATVPSVRRADHIVAISDAARRDMIETLGLSPERIHVTPLGVAECRSDSATPEALLRGRFDAGDRAIVATVSAGRQHKNLIRLIRAFAAVPDDNCLLVIAGDVSRQQEELLRVAAGCGVEHRLRLTGWISDEDLEGLYRAATCAVVPSLMEGFGLPVLEAMARSVPVACSSVSATGEVARGAAELFDPHSEAEISRAITRLLNDPRRRDELIEQGRMRCSDYTWQATARATLDVYRRALEPGAKRGAKCA